MHEDTHKHELLCVQCFTGSATASINNAANWHDVFDNTGDVDSEPSDVPGWREYEFEQACPSSSSSTWRLTDIQLSTLVEEHEADHVSLFDIKFIESQVSQQRTELSEPQNAQVQLGASLGAAPTAGIHTSTPVSGCRMAH